MSPDSNSPSASSQPVHFGKYDIQRRIGAGGMGTVYLATDRDLKRTVALKILPQDRADNPTLVKRFKSEGQTAAHLQHKNIIAVYESGEIEGQLYLALEFVEGIDILEWMRKRGMLPVRRSVEIIRQVTEALQHAFEKQIVHRDIKPSNIMIKSDGTVKLADMGLARFTDDAVDTSITRAGTTVGTVDYMSPEQARDSRAADVRSDIYSLGCSWYHMLTNHIPFPGASLTNKLKAHATDPPPDPRGINPSVPEGVVAVMQRMMAKKPEDRYQTPAELLAELSQTSLTRSGISADLFAALAEDGDAKPEFTLRKGRTPLSIENGAGPTSPEVDMNFEDEDSASDDEFPDISEELAEDEAGKPTGKKSKSTKRGSKSASSSKSASPGKSGSSVGKSSPEKASQKSKSRALPAKAQSSKKQPVGGGSGGSSVSFDVQRLLIILGSVVIGIGAVWGIIWLVSQGSDPVPEPEIPMALPRPEVDPNTGPAKPEIMPEEPAVVEVKAVDFPGTDDASGNDLLNRLLPEWLRAGWGGPANGAPVIRIDRHGQLKSSVRSLAEAMEKRDKKSSVLQFSSMGPWRVAPIEVAAPGTVPQEIMIKGPDGGRSIVLIDADAVGQTWASISRGLIHFQDLDFVIIPSRSTDAPTFTACRLVDCDVSATRCTFTVLANPQQQTGNQVNVFEMTGKSVGGNRLLLRDCALRGPQVTLLSNSGDACDLLCGNCLLQSGAAPIFNLGDAGSTGSAVRRVSLLGSTLLGSGNLIEFTHDSTSAISPIELRLRRCLCGGTGPESRLINLTNWPFLAGGSLEQPVPDQVLLEYEHLRLAHLHELTQMTSTEGSIQTVVDVAEWRQFWKQPLSAEAIRTPSVTPDQLARLAPANLVSELEPDVGPVSDGKPFFGITPANLTILPLDWEQRLQSAAFRSRLPADFGKPAATDNVVRFDLKRAVQFNDFLNGPQCPDGSTVVCFGNGLRMLPPVTLQGKRLRIEFEQAEGTTLTVHPAADSQSSVWFHIEGGHVDFVNAPLTLPASNRRQYPETILRLTGASASLQHCDLISQDAGHLEPMVQLLPSDAQPSRLLIADSFLRSPDQLIALSDADILLELQNSLLATSRTAIGITSGPSQQSMLSQVSAYRCTIVAGHAWERGLMGGDVMDVSSFVRECLFLPPLNSEVEPRVLSTRNPSLQPGLSWWEADCAYAPQWNRWSETENSRDTSTFELDREMFPAVHFVDPVLGNTGVLLTGSLPELASITSESVVLQPACRAAGWCDDAGPTGVRLPVGAQLIPGGVLKTPPPTPGGPRRPAVSRPDF